ncbi:MAG: hypothetical protein ACYDBW_08895 [Sulfuricaulis sp.]
MKRRIFLAVSLLAALLAGCSTMAPATLVVISDHEQGSEPYRTRMIVSADFLRMDDGDGSRDFLLFDRADGTIYSVSSDDRQILVMPRRPVKIPPPKKFTQQVATDTATFPAVDGRKVIHYELLTNHQRCYDLYAAAGLLPDVVRALRQYREALAGQQAVTLAATPPEFQSVCDVANNVFLPARHLDYGFPVRLVDMTGRTTQLLDYKKGFRATPDLFRLPADYKRRTLNELRGK